MAEEGKPLSRACRDAVPNAMQAGEGGQGRQWPAFRPRPRLMATAFWGLNAGLVLMVFTSLLPIGFIQFHASVAEGLWYARSEAFMQQPLLQTLRWVRTLGDVVFIVGAVAMALQVVLGLATGGGRQEGRASALRQQPQ